MREKMSLHDMGTLQKIASNVQKQTGWRYGQCLFNVLYDVDKEMAEEVRGVPEIDPYYRNENIPSFLRYITGGEGHAYPQ